MANTQKPDISPEDLEKAQNLWCRFTVSVKYGVIATIGFLALMALLLL